MFGNKGIQLRSYKPKILMVSAEKPNAPTDLQDDKEKTIKGFSVAQNEKQEPKGFILMGDIETPFTVSELLENHLSKSTTESVSNVRDAPSVTNNPLYAVEIPDQTIGKTQPPSQTATSPVDGITKELKLVHFKTETLPNDTGGHTKMNPLYQSTSSSLNQNKSTVKSLSVPCSQSEMISENNSNQETSNQLTSTDSVDSDAEVYIPEPDYEEEEVTVEFMTEDPEKENNRVKTRIYRDYDGEDFSKYLPDDDNENQINTYTWRKSIKYQMHNKAKFDKNKKAQTEIKREKSRTQKAAKMFQSEPKIKHVASRQTLRYFSVADSKINAEFFADHPNYNNQFRKKANTDQDTFLRTSKSYETYLHLRRKSESSADVKSTEPAELRQKEEATSSKPAGQKGKFIKKVHRGMEQLTFRFRKGDRTN